MVEVIKSHTQTTGAHPQFLIQEDLNTCIVNKLLGDASLGSAMTATGLVNNTLGQILFLFCGRNSSL